MFDQFAKHDHEVCEVNRQVRTTWKKNAMGSLLSADALARVTDALGVPCELETWKREIDEVKTESETRAVVFATVFSTVKPPENADKEAIEEAKFGSKFKYIMEKTAGKWVIADVLRYAPATSYSKAEWRRVYAVSEPIFRGGVYAQ